MKAIIITMLIALTFQATAQSLEGRIYTGRDFLYDATVQIYQKGILKGMRTTGIEGFYSFRALDVGQYDVLLTYPGYDSVLVKDVPVVLDHGTDQGGNLTASSWQAKCIRLQFAPPEIARPTYVSQTNRIEPLQVNYGPRPIGTVYIIDGEPPPQLQPTKVWDGNPREPGRYVFTRQDIERMPTMNLNDIISTLPGVYQQRRGDNISIYGSRMSGNNYVVDGMK